MSCVSSSDTDPTCTKAQPLIRVHTLMIVYTHIHARTQQARDPDFFFFKAERGAKVDAVV